jgi:hypothetical protein
MPSRASRSAISLPRPEVAPVTRAVIGCTLTGCCRLITTKRLPPALQPVTAIERAPPALDEDTRDDIIALLEHPWRDRGLTLILVTHDTSIARRAQRTGVMTNGNLTIRQESPNR